MVESQSSDQVLCAVSPWQMSYVMDHPIHFYQLLVFAVKSEVFCISPHKILGEYAVFEPSVSCARENDVDLAQLYDPAYPLELRRMVYLRVVAFAEFLSVRR